MLRRVSPLAVNSAGSGFDQSSTMSGVESHSMGPPSWLKFRRETSSE